LDSASYKKKNGRYVMKYLNSESFYKNNLLVETVQHFKSFMKGKLLDLGCGNKPYSMIYKDVCESSVGCDVPFSLHTNSKVEVLCYAEDIDKHFEKNSFDCVLCTEVLEHTVNDRKVVGNINKILKQDGYLLVSVPFTYVLHEKPHDYRRYTVFGLQSILETNGFEVLSVVSLGGTFSSGFFILYYSVTKIFFYTFKKAGLNLRSNKLIAAVINIPEYILYAFNISRFRKKLQAAEVPSANEMFSSTGYFIAAKKLKDV